MIMRTLALLLLTTTVGVAQQAVPSSLQPTNNELTDRATGPLMGSGSRIQQFVEVSELGSNIGGLVLISSVSFRFDGPTAGTSAAHVIEELTIDIGATSRGVDEIDAVFDSNTTQPLRRALQLRDYAFVNGAGRKDAGPEEIDASTHVLWTAWVVLLLVAVWVGIFA